MVVFNPYVPFGQPRGDRFNINYTFNRPAVYGTYDQFIAALPGYEAARLADTRMPGKKGVDIWKDVVIPKTCLLYTSPSPRDKRQSRMPSSA